MEAESPAQVVSRHATSLLMSLNLQRNQAQFCDCVIRERQNPSQLYPAHRCVLAASSPVLASILSSTGALVELQAPCLSGSVLALILDYMYTGTLPYSHSQQHYHRLLSAACHLQMDELQETLRAWKQTEVNEVDKTNACTGTKDQSYTNLVNSHNTAESCTMYAPSTCSTDTFWGHGETDTVQSTTGFLERKDHQYPANVDTWDEAQVHSASRDSCIKGRKRVSIIDVENHYSRTDLRPLTDVSICFSVSEHCAGSRGNTGNWRQVTNLAPQDLIQTIPCTEVHKEVQRDQFHSAGNGKPETWQRRTEGDLVRMEEDRRNSCSSSPSPPYPCCGAVPVIRHSSRAAMPQLAEVSPVPPYHPVSQVSAISSRAPFSQPASRDNDSIVQGTATEYKNHYEAQTQDYKCQKTHAGIQSLDHQNTLDQCSIKDLCYKSSTDQSDMLDYSSSSAGHIMKQTDEHMDNGLCHITDHCHQDHHSDTGSDSHSEEVCPRGDNKEEHSYSSRCLTELSRQDPCEPQTDPYPKRRRVEINTQDNRDTATEEEGHSADVCLPIPTMPESDSDVSHGLFERRSSVELGKISDNEITEPHVTFAMPVDNNMCDSMYSVAGQSYHGHLHYHCLPQEDTHFLHKDSDHTRSHLRYPDYSDQSSDEEEAEIFSSPGHSSPRQHFATTTDQVLLLDISAKPAELFVSYKHRSEEEEKSIASCKNDTFGNGAGNNDKQHRNEGTSAVGMDNRDRTNSGAESFNEGCIKSWVAGTTVGERKSVGNDQSRPGTGIMHKAGVVGEFSNPKEGESQTCTMTVCSPPHVPDTVQVSKSSTLSACIAPTLSASMPTNISAHLSTPLHQPFQCSLCERSFSQRGSLNRHVRSHLGVRPFPCPCCPMTFSRQYRVTEHMRVHQRCTLGSDFHKPPTTSS